MAKIEDKKPEEISSKSGPEAEGIEYIDYQFKVRCTKLPGGLTKACTIQDIQIIPQINPTGEVPPQTVEEATLKTVDTVQPETKPGEKDPECNLCDAIETALKEKAASAAKPESVAPRLQRRLPRSPPWARRQSTVKT